MDVTRILGPVLQGVADPNRMEMLTFSAKNDLISKCVTETTFNAHRWKLV